MEPFTSNDTYACPDCGSEVRVGARSCPGCGPFRPVEWEESEDVVDGFNNEPTSPFHSMTTYTDTREVLEKSHRPEAQLPEPPAEKTTRFIRLFLTILIGLTTLAASMAALKVLLAR